MWTAADLRLTGTRAPTATELAPVVGVLDRGDFYADPSITPAPTDHSAWAMAGAGKPVKVVVLPFADPSARAVDWTTPLAARYPQAVVLVMTGKWIESAGTDRQVMVDAINQTYGLGGFAIAASAPAYDTILDWVTGIDSSAQSSHAFSRSLPVLPDTSFPRWLAYLLLATSLIIAAGFVVNFVLGRRRSATGTPRERWRAQVLTGLTDAYVTLSAAPVLGPGGPGLSSTVQGRLDQAYATLLQLRGEDLGAASSAAELVQSAWSDLDAAAKSLHRPDAAPSTTLPKSARHEPAAPPRRAVRRRRWPRPLRLTLWLALAAVGLGAAVLVFSLFRGTTRSYTSAAQDLTPLRTSSVASFAGAAATTATTDAIRAVIGDRASLIAEIGDHGSKFDSIDLADQIADAYPNAVAFVVRDGAIESASLGSDAATSGYDDYSLIDDYYGVQLEGSGDLAVARQIALLYDRLGSSHSIRPGLRSTYDPPGPPWVLIAIGLVLAMGVAALLVRFGTGRVLRAGESDQDERAVRDALRLRIAGQTAALPDPAIPTRGAWGSSSGC